MAAMCSGGSNHNGRQSPSLAFTVLTRWCPRWNRTVADGARRKKPTLFPRNRCYLRPSMSRLTLSLFAVVAIAVVRLSAQVAPAAPAPVQQPVPAAPPGVPPPAAAPVVVATPPAAPAPVQDPNALKFDAESKDFNAKQGDTSAAFTFTVTNVSKSAVAINRLSTSCGCTVAQLPSTPYNLEPGSNVAINVSMDLHGKVGQVTKTV